MKKIFYLFITLSFYNINAQGKLYIQNYTNYDIIGRIFSRGNSGCYPSVWSSYKLPAGGQVAFDEYNDSAGFIDTWYFKTSANGTINSQSLYNPPPPNVLTNLSLLTQWQYSWFRTEDSNGNPTGDDFWMGDSVFSSPCGVSTVSDYVAGNYSEAFWFYLPTQNETYIIIQ